MERELTEKFHMENRIGQLLISPKGDSLLVQHYSFLQLFLLSQQQKSDISRGRKWRSKCRHCEQWGYASLYQLMIWSTMMKWDFTSCIYQQYLYEEDVSRE